LTVEISGIDSDVHIKRLIVVGFIPNSEVGGCDMWNFTSDCADLLIFGD